MFTIKAPPEPERGWNPAAHSSCRGGNTSLASTSKVVAGHGAGPRRRSRVLLAVLAVLVVGVLATSCSTSTPTSRALDTSLTRDAAQNRILQLFSDVLGRAPATLFLAQAAPRPNLEAQENGITVPCNDSNTVTNSPLNLQVAFWVQGVTDGGETEAYHALVTSFVDAGWSPAPDENGPSKITRAYTPDGYALIAQLNSVGGLSLTGSSPCFPAAGDTTPTPQPTAVPHPAG